MVKFQVLGLHRFIRPWSSNRCRNGNCKKLKHKDHKVIVITGDGELNEGSNWEALMSAANIN